MSAGSCTGLDDKGELGELRVKRSLRILQKTDFAIYCMDINDMDDTDYHEMIKNFKKYSIPHMLVINKIDTASNEKLLKAQKKYNEAVFVSAAQEKNILALKDELVKRIQDDEVEETIVGDVVPYNGKIIMVVPVDSEAPKGRLILPQVQLIRDCLDHGIKSYVVRDTELENALMDIEDIDLVVTDSQVFKKVNQLVPESIKLTSFSILFARYKGDLDVFVDGVSKIK